MKIVLKGISALITTATLAVILITAGLVVPAAFGYAPYIVSSGSMEPAIHTGAVIFVNVNDTDCAIGDIITYQPDHSDVFVTHRIYDTDLATGSFITKGDANEGADPVPVRSDQVAGTCVFQIPEVGFLLSLMDGKAGIVLIVWIVLLNGFAVLLERAADFPA